MTGIGGRKKDKTLVTAFVTKTVRFGICNGEVVMNCHADKTSIKILSTLISAQTVRNGLAHSLIF